MINSVIFSILLNSHNITWAPSTMVSSTFCLVEYTASETHAGSRRFCHLFLRCVRCFVDPRTLVYNHNLRVWKSCCHYFQQQTVVGTFIFLEEVINEFHTSHGLFIICDLTTLQRNCKHQDSYPNLLMLYVLTHII